MNCLSSHSVITWKQREWNALASDLWLFHFLSQEMLQVCFLVPAEDALCLYDSCSWKTIWNRKQSLYNIILYRLRLQIIHQLVTSDVPRMLMLLSITAVEHSLPSAEIHQCWYSEQHSCPCAIAETYPYIGNICYYCTSPPPVCVLLPRMKTEYIPHNQWPRTSPTTIHQSWEKHGTS